MYCNKCGIEISDNQTYCEKCSKEHNQNVEAAPNQKSNEKDYKQKGEKPKDPSNVFGIIALVMSILGILQFIPLIGPICGIIFGKLSKNTEGEQLGTIGLIIGIVGLIIESLAIILAIITEVIGVGIYLFLFIVPFVIALIGTVVSEPSGSTGTYY